MPNLSPCTRWTLPFLAAGLLACGGDNGNDNQDDFGDPVDLSGVWIALGYDCGPDFDAAELIDVEISDNDLLATKLVGDDCVPTGMETLRGELPDPVREGMDLDVEIQRADGSAFLWEDALLEVVSEDEFLVPAGSLPGSNGDILFFRTSTDDLANVDISGEWMGWGYTCGSSTRTTQTIDFIVDGDDVTAVKITGDDCIAAGETTWEGSRNGPEMDGEIFGTAGSDPAIFDILAHDFMLLNIDGGDEFFYFWRTP